MPLFLLLLLLFFLLLFLSFELLLFFFLSLDVLPELSVTLPTFFDSSFVSSFPEFDAAAIINTAITTITIHLPFPFFPVVLIEIFSFSCNYHLGVCETIINLD
ncbi:hypothetical protein DWZ63_03525 [Clostridium sp. AF34-13]|nr:hypothetical protein DWZ63_03525 [Clostridium sp. AF34-13]RHU74576.1 hypothetical protein DXC30_11585 [Butyribacter intestini]